MICPTISAGIQAMRARKGEADDGKATVKRLPEAH